MIAAEFGTGQVFWSLLWLSLFCIWVWMFIMVFGDLIRSRRLSGWGKALDPRVPCVPGCPRQ